MNLNYTLFETLPDIMMLRMSWYLYMVLQEITTKEMGMVISLRNFQLVLTKKWQKAD